MLYYATILQQHGAEDHMIQSVLNRYDRVKEWQKTHLTQLPDIPADSVRPATVRRDPPAASGAFTLD